MPLLLPPVMVPEDDMLLPLLPYPSALPYPSPLT